MADARDGSSNRLQAWIPHICCPLGSQLERELTASINYNRLVCIQYSVDADKYWLT